MAVRVPPARARRRAGSTIEFSERTAGPVRPVDLPVQQRRCAPGWPRRAPCSRAGRRRSRRPARRAAPCRPRSRPGRCAAARRSSGAPIRRASTAISAAPAAEASQAAEPTGPISAAARSGVTDHLGEADRHQALEGDHAEAPEQLDRDQRQHDPRPAQQPQRAADRAPAPPAPRRPARPARGAGRSSVISSGHGDQRDDLQDERDQHRHGQRRRPGRPGRARPARRWPARRRRWPAPSTTPLRLRPGLDVGVRVGGQGVVDVPGLERAAVQRPVDALQQVDDHEQDDRVGDREQRQRRELDQPASSSTGRRPIASDSPPVGSSSTSTMRPCAAAARPILGQGQAALERAAGR